MPCVSVNKRLPTKRKWMGMEKEGKISLILRKFWCLFLFDGVKKSVDLVSSFVCRMRHSHLLALTHIEMRGCWFNRLYCAVHMARVCWPYKTNTNISNNRHNSFERNVVSFFFLSRFGSWIQIINNKFSSWWTRMCCCSLFPCHSKWFSCYYNFVRIGTHRYWCDFGKRKRVIDLYEEYETACASQLAIRYVELQRCLLSSMLCTKSDTQMIPAKN